MFFRDLETDRLFLKNISSDDREFVFTQFTDGRVNQYLFDAEPLTDMQDADEIIDFYVQPEPRAQHRWIIVRKEDGAKIGTCGFHCWNNSIGYSDVGYDLYPDFWGKGYMYEAMQSVLTFARNDIKIKQINACIYPENIKSVKLAKKCGFTFNGQMKDEFFNGEKYPHNIMVLDFTAV